MKCYIVKDLLPNYIDGLTGEEANREIKKHLVECDDCRNIYIQMSAVIPQEMPQEDKHIDFLKKIRASIWRKNVLIALSVCVILAGLVIFAKTYRLPIAFDPNHMWVEFHPAVALTNESGVTFWRDLDYLDFESTKEIIANLEDYEIIDVAETVCEDLTRGTQDLIFRNLNRNGEAVMVIYFCYTETLWDSLFFDIEHGGTFSSTWPDVTLGSRLRYRGPYEPTLKEIYYLPTGNMDGLEKLSDEEFDAQRENATLVWSGMI